MKLHKLLIALAIGTIPFSLTYADSTTGPSIDDITMGVMQKDDPAEITHMIELPEQASDVARENVAKQHPEKDDHLGDGLNEKNDDTDHNSAQAVKEAAHNAAQDIKEAAHDAAETSADVKEAAHEATTEAKESAQESVGESHDSAN